jgi:hypothetical protein
MVSSSSNQQGIPESTAQEAPAYDIKGRTMKLEEWELMVQIENPVDFASLDFHKCWIRSYYKEQGLMPYFSMLNGPTYEAMVRHFWVRASIYDKDASIAEEREKVLLYPSLKGKTRKEMGLEPFKYTEIRSSICGIPVVIAEWHIASVLGVEAYGKYSGIEISGSEERL